MQIYTENEKFEIKIPQELWERIKQQAETSNNTHEFEDYATSIVRAAINVSFEVQEKDIEIQNQEAKIQVEVKGNIIINDIDFETIFLSKFKQEKHQYETETKEQLLHRIGKKYLNTKMRDTGYGATGLTGTVIDYELGKNMNGVWLKLDLGEGQTSRQYRSVK